MKTDFMRRLHGGCGESLNSRVTGPARRPSGKWRVTRAPRQGTAHAAKQRGLEDRS